MKNLLFVSIAFPPKSDAEGLQVAKYLKYMTRLGAGAFAIDAVTSALPTLNMPHDASLEPMRQGVRQVVELPIYENRYTNFLLRKVLPWAATMPDPKSTFHLQAQRVARQLRARPDLIYSRAFPLSSAVLALRLKRLYGVPWVMHLSDIWADCPERNYQGLSRRIQERLEQQCFEAADVICVTSEKTRAFYRSKYPHLAHRLEHYPNVFDPEDAPAPAGAGSAPDDAAGDKFRIVHTGSLAGSRSPAPLLEALSRLDAATQARLEVLLVGPVDFANAQVVKHWNLPFVKLHGQVQYTESLRLQRSADLLVLIDMPVANPALRVYFPSKLLDYMLAGRPILAIGDEGSEIQHVLQTQALGRYVERADIAALSHCLAEAVHQGRAADRPPGRSAPQVYSAEFNAARLLAQMKGLLGTHDLRVTQVTAGDGAGAGPAASAVAAEAPARGAASRPSAAAPTRRRRVAIVSYGTGNLASLSDALEAAGARCNVATQASDLVGAEALVLPGVGHFGHAMSFFRASGLLEPALHLVRSGMPTLGICLGFQLLTHASEEAAGQDGLAVLPCTTTRIRPADASMHKVPHLGWNAIDSAQGAPILLEGIAAEDRLFYYANAYAVRAEPPLALPHATFEHGAPYLALVEKGTVFGVQFHPEKSRSQGLRLLSNFLAV